MRIPIRTSRWAIWARRTASIALPLQLIPVFLHRERMIASDAFTILFGAGLVLAGIAVVVSVIAFGRLWQSGTRGWGRTIQALILGLILVSPAGIAINWALIYPRANDVATDGPTPELSLVRNPMRIRLSAEETLSAFPTAIARSYALPPQRVFDLAVELVAARQWEARLRRKPVAPAYPGRIHALAMTLLGYRDEVAIDIDWTDGGTLVSMRSASTYGVSDLGVNGTRIEAFLADLDKAVSELQREAPILDTTPTPEGGPTSASENAG